MIDRRFKNALAVLGSLIFLPLLSTLAWADEPAFTSASPELAKQVKARMLDVFGENCETEYEPNKTVVLPPLPGAAPRLVRTWCVLGVYQLYSLHFLWWPNGRLELLPFAVPKYRHRVDDKDKLQQTVIEGVEGFRTLYILAGSKYDPKTATIHSVELHRSLADTATLGRWRWRGRDGFVLEHYETDQSLDGVLAPAVVYSSEQAAKSKPKKK